MCSHTVAVLEKAQTLPPITAYMSRIDDVCGPSLGHEDRDVAPKNTVSVDVTRVTLRFMFQVPCAH